MTRHTTTSTTGRARRAAIGLMALGLLLSGCAAGPAAEAPTTTATPTPTAVADPHALSTELAATFPTEAEWLENYEIGRHCFAETAGQSSCGGADWPIPGTMSNGFNLRAGVTDVTAGAVMVVVAEWNSAEESAAQLEESKAADVLFTGDFDIPFVPSTKTAGERGAGTLVDLERDGWTGYRMTQTSVKTGSDGNPLDDEGETVTNSIVMTNGPLIFTLRVYWASPEPGVADAETDGWLDRVFGPEAAK